MVSQSKFIISNIFRDKLLDKYYVFALSQITWDKFRIFGVLLLL